jgi:uncharacterized protein
MLREFLANPRHSLNNELSPKNSSRDRGTALMYHRFSLTLVLNHACNLRCRYCYTGEKIGRRLPQDYGERAIQRAVASVEPSGTLDVGFFGGEPLLEAPLLLELMKFAEISAARRGIGLRFNVTTNATVRSPAAWAAMMHPDLDLAISHDGLPAVHDAQRVSVDGTTTSDLVEETMESLHAAGKPYRVVMVMQPQSVSQLPEGLQYLYERGVRRFEPSLNLWTTWTVADGELLARSIGGAADFWGTHLPECGVSWFDEQAARLARVPIDASARCGFGGGEIAISPAGNLYPCERLVGADEPTNPMRLPGHVMDGGDFLSLQKPPGSSPDECLPCVLREQCSTAVCYCSNYVRTGSVTRPDRLLCMFDQVCYRETARVLSALASPCTTGA